MKTKPFTVLRWFVFLVFGCSVHGITINVNSRINGDLPSGFPPYEISVSAGSWLVTPTNPSLDSDALFTAWSQYASAQFWNSALVIREKKSGVYHFIGTFSGDTTPTPGLAFIHPLNVPYSFTLSGPETLQFFVQDNQIFDNRGGVSVRLEQAVAVPDGRAISGLLLAFASGLLFCFRGACHRR